MIGDAAPRRCAPRRRAGVLRDPPAVVGRRGGRESLRSRFVRRPDFVRESVSFRLFLLMHRPKAGKKAVPDQLL